MYNYCVQLLILFLESTIVFLIINQILLNFLIHLNKTLISPEICN